MDDVLGILSHSDYNTYLDNILVFGISLEEDIGRLKSVFGKLKNNCLKVQLDKSRFLQKYVYIYIEI